MNSEEQQEATNSPQDASQPAMSPEYIGQLLSYREELVRLTESSQRDFDHRVLALSGSAFGVTFTFAEKFVPANCLPEYGFLFAAFICWTLSILAVLFSFFFSVRALGRTREGVDEAIRTLNPEKLKSANMGGWSQTILETLNIMAGVFFVCGILLTIQFVRVNNSNVCPPPSNDEVSSLFGLNETASSHPNNREEIMSIEETSELANEDPSLSAGSSLQQSVEQSSETPEEKPVTRGMVPPPPPPVAGSASGTD